MGREAGMGLTWTWVMRRVGNAAGNRVLRNAADAAYGEDVLACDGGGVALMPACLTFLGQCSVRGIRRVRASVWLGLG